MLIAGITGLPFLRPVLALVAIVCLLFTGQLAHSESSDLVAPRIDIHTLHDSLSLQGQWRFLPGDNLDWAAPELDDSGWGYMAVPGRWPAGGYPETGQLAWYRITLQLVPESIGRDELANLAVRMGTVLSAYELYAGGKFVGSVGKLPPFSEATYDRQRVYGIPASAVAADGRLVLAMRVWGGDEGSVQAWSAGASAGEYRLGDFRQLLMTALLGEIPGLLFCALILAFGCYHLYLYSRNRALESYLWFGLAALNIALYGLMLTQFKYLLDMPFLIMKKIEFGAIYLFPAIGIQLVWSVLQKPIGNLLRAYQWSFVLLAIIVVVVPGHQIHYISLPLEQYWLLPMMMYVPYVVLQEARAGNAEARTIAFGTLIFLAACLNDMLIDLTYLDTIRLAPIGFGAIMVSMAISMANRFTSMYSTLESEVALRTSELSLANETLARTARRDHLTSLLNRRGFTEEAETEISRVFRTGKAFSLVLADVDKFKDFNDLYGHACGDHVLMRLGAILMERTRDIDKVARWGGEEFVLLLPATGSDGAAVLAEALREAIADSVFEFQDASLSITMTFGIATHRRGESLDACLARADAALYEGKERGRNKVMIGSYKGLTLVN